MQAYTARDQPRGMRNYFNIGSSIWDGKEFRRYTPIEVSPEEVSEWNRQMAEDGLELSPQRITFNLLWMRRRSGNIVSLGAERRMRFLLDRLQNNADYRARHQKAFAR